MTRPSPTITNAQLASYGPGAWTLYQIAAMQCELIRFRRVVAILRPSGRPTCPHGKLSGIECQGWPCPGYAVLREGMDRVSLQQAGARLHAARSRAMQGRGR